jgi:hypothetical protein
VFSVALIKSLELARDILRIFFKTGRKTMPGKAPGFEFICPIT